jgi:hypothetical protein
MTRLSYHLPQLHSQLLDVVGVEAHQTVELEALWEGGECLLEMGLG